MYYKAQILMLGATRQELEQKKKASRVRIPKVLDTSVESSSSEDECEVIQKETAKIRKEAQRSMEAAKQRSLKSMIKQKLEKKKASPVFESVNHAVQEVAQSCQSKDCASKLHSMKRRCMDAEATIAKLEAETKRARTEAAEYQKLNKQLQTQLLEALRGKTDDNVKKSTPEPLETEVCSVDDMPAKEGPSYVEEDGKISLGAGISLTSRQWNAVNSQNKNSLFVKGLAVAVWGTNVLKDRSVEGKLCPRFSQREAKAPLSPEKLKAVKECFMNRLQRQKVSKEEMEMENKKFKRYLSEKIQDINRLMKKQAKQ
ncbi:BEN domain-containing protein 5-like [Acanthaster planci]|uniref:BEN domain-containing protein 5-like n=1 Tax=Acanthaster planci TaxID=133434 RepID=A0A8B7ZDH0_ACAPL|nr:BEN domain-containing protein 5-like [Acanthaster planci]